MTQKFIIVSLRYYYFNLLENEFWPEQISHRVNRENVTREKNTNNLIKWFFFNFIINKGKEETEKNRGKCTNKWVHKAYKLSLCMQKIMPHDSKII